VEQTGAEGKYESEVLDKTIDRSAIIDQAIALISGDDV
jgi:hypothetical protein